MEMRLARRFESSAQRRSVNTHASASSRRWAIGRLQATAAQDSLLQATRAQIPDDTVRAAEAVACSSLSRRGALAVLLLLHAGSNGAPALELEQPAELRPFEQAKQGYSMQVPSSWTAKEKAGADTLFQDPQRTSSNLGVTVSPVRVRTISEFGDVASVGEKLLQAERNKESTLSVEMLSQGSRVLETGSVLYDYEYELNSTRGRKRIINTVSISNSKLYIFNGQVKCAAEQCAEQDVRSIQVLRDVARSFVVQ